jgi:putative ABC transport system permease protein
MLMSFLQDIRYGCRMFGRNPGVSAVAILSIALGIGVSSAIFTLINGFLLKPLPVDEPDRLAAIYLTHPELRRSTGFSYPDYLDYRDQSTVFSDLVGASGIVLSLSSGERPELVHGQIATGGYFSGLGVKPAIGRMFLSEEERTPGTHPVTVLSHNFWQRRFGGDPGVLGETLRLNGQDLTVVGVAAEGFTGTQFMSWLPDLWIPIMMQGQVDRIRGESMDNRAARHLAVYGRLKPGVSLEQAETEMNTIARRLAEDHSRTNAGLNVRVTPGRRKTAPLLEIRDLLGMASAAMLGMVALILLIVSANLANLLLARASDRRRETAIRVALGANRWRLIRQILTESTLLAVIGGACGLLVAVWLTEMFSKGMPVLEFPVVDLAYDLKLDWRILGFTVFLCLSVAALSSIAPGLAAWRFQQASALGSRTGGADEGAGRWTTRNVLVISQVALSLILLTTGGLFLRSAYSAESIDPGFETDQTVMASMRLDLQGYDRIRGEQFYGRLLERVEALPDVASATLAYPLPLDESSKATRVAPEGYVPSGEQERVEIFYSTVGPKYFQTLGTPIVEGRGFDDRDREEAPRVAVINETMARRFWPNQSGIGKRFRIGREDGPHLQVVGVAKDGKYLAIGENPMPYFFVPLEQNYEARSKVVVRTHGNPAEVMSSLRAEVRALDASLPLYGVKTMKQFMTRSVGAPWGLAAIVAFLALLSVALSVVGVYGVVAYSVAKRTQEFGIRMALGAEKSDVLRLVIRQGFVVVLVGVVIGLAGAFGVTRLMSSLLLDVGATDAVTFTCTTLLMVAVGVLAIYIPARRAAKVDPMVALRYE